MSLNQKKNIRFISGNEALAHGAYEEGLRVACAYPGTPSTEILEYCARIPEIESQWSVNEKVAFEVALGASIRGARSLCAAKHVGVNVAMDPLMTSAYTGVGAGFVLVSCDDPGIHSSQNEQDNRLFAKAAKIPLIEPSSPSEAYSFIKTAFQVSEEFDTPVMVRMTTRISHTKENVITGTRKDIPVRPFTVNVPKYVMVPGNAYKRHIELEQRLMRLKQYAEKTALNTIEINDRARGFITSGVSYLYAKEMYPGASFLKLGFSWPFPVALVKSFSRKVKEVYVIEELEPFLEEHVRLAGIACKGKHPSFRIGELKPEHIPYIIRGKPKEEKASSARKPVLCPGCPHRAVFAVLKKLKKIVTGDIGCYTLGALPPLSSLHTCVCMGSGITFFEGFGKAGERNAVGVIGDSTFVHSGITGLINAAYNKARGVIIILDNSTTAMTGNQPHPGTGVTIRGEQTKKLSLEDLCRVCGADSVDVINPQDSSVLEKLIIQRTQENALSVIIARYPCRFVLKVTGRSPAYDKDKCSKCYLCLTVDCPAIRRSEDGYIVVDNSLCAGCNVCVQMCRPGALSGNKTRHET